MADETLPFAITLITNESAETSRVHARRKKAFSAETSRAEALDVTWPLDTVSLSHVALPIPPDDPLYGQRPPGNDDALFLGQMPIKGERGLLKLRGDWLLRLRHNPFYEFFEAQALAWMVEAGRRGSLGSGS